MRNKLIHVGLIVVLTMIASGELLAKINTVDVVNESDINAMFFWVTDLTGTPFFDSIDPEDDAKDLNGIFKNANQLVVLEPPTGDPTVLATNATFKVKFDYTVKNVDVYWAEVFFNGTNAIVKASGNGHFDDKSNNPNNMDWYVQTAFDSSYLSLSMVNDINTHFAPVVAPVPIPSSVVMFLSAIVMVSVTQRRKIDLSQTMKFAAQKTADLGSTLKFAAQTTVDLGSTLTFKAQTKAG